MITSGMLTLARSQRARLFDKTLQVQAFTTTTRPGGGVTDSWQTIPGGTLLCGKRRIERATEEQLIAGTPKAKHFYNIYIAHTSENQALGIDPTIHRLLVDGELLELAQAPEPDSNGLSLWLLAYATE